MKIESHCTSTTL